MTNPWEQIKTPLSSYNVRRADPRHLYDFFWGRDISGDYLFLFQCEAGVRFPSKIPSLHGIELILPAAGEEGKTRMILRLNNRDDWDIFHSLCLDLLQTTGGCASEESVIAVIVRRLERWHLFLKTSRPRLMSESEQKGLIGELLFLRDYVLPRYSVSEALSFWQGPLDAPQDFCIGDTAVEVKCQLGTSKPLIRISSIEQLNTQLSRLYLFVVTMGKGTEDSDGVINLPLLIHELRDRILNSQPACSDLFEDLLLKAGYIDLQEYGGYFFILSSARFYEAGDEFPRLDPEDIPDGILNVTMDIMLDRCSQFIVEGKEVILG